MQAFARIRRHPSTCAPLSNVGPWYGSVRYRTILLVLFGLLAAAFAPQSARAGDLIEWVEIYEDKTATETIDQIISRPFVRTEQKMNKGYSKSAFWLRIKLRANQILEDDTVLQVVPATAGSVTFFQEREGKPGEWEVHDDFDDLRSALHGVHIHPSKGDTVVYLRVSSVGTLNLRVNAYDLQEALSHTVVRTALCTGYIAALFVLVVWAVRAAVLTRDRIFLGFALLQSLWILHNLFAFGMIQIVPSEWLERNRELVYRLLVLSLSFITVGFHRRLLGASGTHRAVLLMLRLMQGGIACAVVLFLAGFRHEAMYMNALCIVAVPFLLFAGALTIRGAFLSETWQVKAVYVIYSLLFMVWSISITGQFRPSVSNFAAVIIHGASTSVLIYVVLNAHSKKFLRRLADAEESLLDEQVRSGVQREQNRLLARFIDMLAHETRNAHAVVRMSVALPQLTEKARSRINSSLARVDGVIERSVQMARLEAGSVLIQQERFALAPLLEETLATLPVEGRVDLVCDAPDTIFTDRLLLKVALANLVENALKYAAAGSRIKLDVSGSAGHVSFQVRNDIGRSGAPEPEEVFKKFFRGAGTEAIPGTGLGLYLVQSIARLLGGRASYGGGEGMVQFTVRIPC